MEERGIERVIGLPICDLLTQQTQDPEEEHDDDDKSRPHGNVFDEDPQRQVLEGDRAPENRVVVDRLAFSSTAILLAN